MKTGSAKYPEISVIIPTHNRCDVLHRTLTALEQQDLPADMFQVIVIDDNSSDSTLDVLKEYAAHGILNLEFIKISAHCAAGARNRGIAEAAGDILLFLDSDTIPDVDVVRLHLLLHRRLDEHVCVMGHVTMAPELMKKEQARLWDTEMEPNTAPLEELDWWKYRTANTSIKSSILSRAGGFNIQLAAAEDTELAYRLAQLQVQFYYVQEIRVTHYHPLNVLAYMQKGEQYGRAVGYWYTKAPELRPQLVLRYGVYASELPRKKRTLYTIRNLFINTFTMPFILTTGRVFRFFWFFGSDVLYKCAFRFYTRRAFSRYLRLVHNIQDLTVRV